MRCCAAPLALPKPKAALAKTATMIVSLMVNLQSFWLRTQDVDHQFTNIWQSLRQANGFIQY
jgi:hypothetical protein